MKDITEQTFTSDAMKNVPFSKRVLLLPHCLRPSLDCPGKITKQGLDCTGCDHTECAIYQLRAAAAEAGYKGVCVAPGGRLALRFLTEQQPAGIVAVACAQELEEGIEAVAKMEWEGELPAVTVIPLSRDGCVDTEVDVEAAREIIFGHNGAA